MPYVEALRAACLEPKRHASVPCMACLIYSASMNSTAPPFSPQGCDPSARAARVAGNAAGCPHQSLRLPPASLQGALLALVARDTRHVALTDAQRLTHFPASPLVAISWFSGMEVGMVEQGGNAPAWRAFGAQVVVSGSQSHPSVSWAPSSGRGYMAFFSTDAARLLFGLDLAATQDRFLPVGQVIGSDWSPLWEALLGAEDADVLAVLEQHLAARWQALQGRASAQPSLRQLGRHWVTRLAWQAQQWRQLHGERHVERRIKAFSGRSLREWEALVKTEGLFFAARDRFEAGQPFEWAALAQDHGFSDQAHMSRVSRRITGFAPGEFASRFEHDESFWLYRLWM